MAGGEAVPLEAMWQLSLTWYEARLDVNFRPPPRSDLQELLAVAGLVGPWWELP